MKLILIAGVLSVLFGCGGGGESSPPPPSLTSNTPTSVFDDETIVITLRATNLGAGEITYSASSATLSIVEGAASNEFRVLGTESTVGSHSLNFTANSTSGGSVSLTESITVDAVPTGYWVMQSVSVGGIEVPNLDAYAVVSRRGTIAVGSFDYDLFVEEKCFGESDVTEDVLTFEAQCVASEDGLVSGDTYRLSGELSLQERSASGTYSVYDSGGGLVGTAQVELARFDFYRDFGLEPPSSAAGTYLGVNANDANRAQVVVVDESGAVTTSNSDLCDIYGTALAQPIDPLPGSEYVERGIFDFNPISQVGCRSSVGDFRNPNRDILSGIGMGIFISGSFYGFPPYWDVLVIELDEGGMSVAGPHSQLYYFKICDAQGMPSQVAQDIGLVDPCNG